MNGAGNTGSAVRGWRGYATILALFVLAFGTVLQVGHRPASGASPGVVSGAWMVICGPAGKVLLPASEGGQSETPHNQIPYCPVCLALHIAAIAAPLPQAMDLRVPVECGAPVYANMLAVALPDSRHSPQTARGPPIVA
jgi:hypothetical protein